MSAAQLALFPAPEEIAAPDLIGCGLAYLMAGRMEWGEMVLCDASGPPSGWRQRVYREALVDYRKRRVRTAEIAAGAGVPEPAAAAFVKGMWFYWSGKKWQPLLTDDNLARIIEWQGLPEPTRTAEDFG